MNENKSSICHNECVNEPQKECVDDNFKVKPSNITTSNFMYSDPEMSETSSTGQNTNSEAATTLAPHRVQVNMVTFKKHSNDAEGESFRENMSNIENILKTELQNIGDNDDNLPELTDSEGDFTSSESEWENNSTSDDDSDSVDLGDNKAHITPTKDVKVNKTTLTYANQKNKAKYTMPAVDCPEDSMYKDKRDQYEVFRDILLKLNQTYTPEVYQLYCDIANYDVKTPTYSKTGMSMLKEDVDKLIKDFKKGKLNPKQKRQVDECQDLVANLTESELNNNIKYGYSVNNTSPIECRCSVTRSCIKKCKRRKSECRGKCHLDSDIPFTCVCSAPVSAEATNLRTSANDVTGPKEANTAQSTHSSAGTGKHSLPLTINNLTSLISRNDITSKEKQFLDKCSKVPSHLNKYHRRKINNLANKYSIQFDIQSSKQDPEIVECKNIHGTGLPFIDLIIGRTDQQATSTQFIQGLVDSGCDANIVNISKIRHLKLKQSEIDRSKSYILRTAGGKKEATVTGSIDLAIYVCIESKFYKIALPFLIVSDEFQLESGIILGNTFMERARGKLDYDGKNKILWATFQNAKNNNIDIKIPCRPLYQNSFICNNLSSLSEENSQLTLNTAHIPQNGLYHIDTEDNRITLKNNLCVVDNSSIVTMPSLASDLSWPVQLSAATNIHASSLEHIDENSINFILTKCEQPYCGHKHVSRKEDDLSENVQPDRQDTNNLLEPAADTSQPENDSPPIPPKVRTTSCELHNNSLLKSENFDNSLSCPCPDIFPSKEDSERYQRNKEILLSQVNQVQKDSSISPPPENIEDSFMRKDDLMPLATDLGKISLKHLTAASKEKVKKLNNKYKEAFSSQDRPVGKFLYFQAHFDVKNPKKAKQKNRNVNFKKAPKAEKKIEDMMKQGILEEYREDPASVANFVLVAKPKAGSTIRTNSKADKMLAKRNPDVGIDYRLTVDMVDLNYEIVGAQHVSLPKLSEVKELVRDKITTAMDIQDGYTSIEVGKESQKYMNVHYKDTMVVFKRLIQGISISPNIFVSAMRACFHDDILREFLAMQQWSSEDFPYKTWKEFLLYYIDDCLVFTKKEGGEDLHLKALECVLHAIQRCGLLFSPKKAQIMVDELHFLGHLLTPKQSFSEMAPERASAILDIRTPRSCGELISRMSFWSWSSEYLPAVKLISLPLHKMAHSGQFKWGKAEAEAFTEVKLLCALRVKNHSFKAHLPQFLTCDASKVAGAFAHFQLNEEGQLELVNTQSTILGQPQVRSPSVIRESATLMWAIGASEPYILATEGSFTALTDCSCLQFISRSKFHHSRFYEYSVALSQYPSLEILYIPGFLNATSDLLSRQFQDVFLTSDSALSEKQSRLIPPMTKTMRSKILSLSHEELTRYILSSPPAEYVDCHDKKLLYHQPGMSKSELEKTISSCAPEQELFSFLLQGWQNPDLYSLPVIKELIQKQKTLTKTSFTEILKKWKLSKLHEKLEKLGVNQTFMSKLRKMFKNEDYEKSKKRLSSLSQPTKVNAVTRRQAKVMREENQKENDSQPSEPAAAISQTDMSADVCTECTAGYHEKLDSKLMDQFSANKTLIDTILNSLQQLVPCLTKEEDKYLLETMSSFHQSSCQLKKFQIFTLILPEVLKLVSSGDLLLRNDTDPSMNIYFYCYNIKSEDLNFTIYKSSIRFYLKQDISLEAYGMKKINLKAFLSIKCPIDIISKCSEDIYFETQQITEGGCHIFGGLLLNLTNTEQTLKSGSCIFSIDFSSAQTKTFAPVEVDQNLIENKLRILNNFSNYSSLLHWEEIMTKYLSAQNSPKPNQSIQKPINSLQTTRLKQTGEEWCSTLNGILLAKSLSKNQGALQFEDLVKLQESDSHLSKLRNECQRRGIYRNFLIEDNLLYYQAQSKEMNDVTVKLCLPNNFAQMLLQSFHSVTQNHLSCPQMEKLFSSLFYTHKLSAVVKRVWNSCLVCNISEPKRKRKIYGSHRSQEDVARIGQIWFYDTAYLPPSKFNAFTAIGVYTEYISGYTSAFCMKNVDSTEAAKTLSSMLCSHQGMKAICSDLGPETRGEFEKLATFNNILIHSPVPQASNPQAHVEVAIRYLKEELTRVSLCSIPNKRRDWPTLLPQILNNYNTQRLTSCRLSRRAIFYSPLHYNSLGFGIKTKFIDSSAPSSHLQCIDKIKAVRKAALGKLSNVEKGKQINTGDIVKQTINDKEAETLDKSKGIQSTVKDYYKINEIMSGRMAYRGTSLMTGDEKTLRKSEIEKIDPEDLLGLELKASDLFKNIKDARLHTSYKKLSKGIQFMKPEPDTRVSNVSTRLSPLKSLLKKSKLPSTFTFNHIEAYEAAMKGVTACQQANIPLTDAQQLMIKTNYNFCSQDNYRKIYLTDNNHEIMKRKLHPRRVSFENNIHLKEIPNRENGNTLWMYSIKATLFKERCCISRSELRLIK